MNPIRAVPPGVSTLSGKRNRGRWAPVLAAALTLTFGGAVAMSLLANAKAVHALPSQLNLADWL